MHAVAGHGGGSGTLVVRQCNGDVQVGSTGGTVPTTHLHVVGVTGGHRDRHCRTEVRGGAAVIIGSKTGVASLGAGSAVVDDQDTVIEGSCGSAGLDGGVTGRGGGVKEPHVGAHVGVTVTRTV